MKRLSLRWKLTLATSAATGAAAVLLVFVAHGIARQQLLEEIDHQLSTRCEEVDTVVGLDPARFDPRVFVEVETRYSSTPYEYFYEFVDASGHVLLHSDNLDDDPLGPLPVDPPQPTVITLASPHDPAGEIRARSERLPTGVEIDGRRATTLHVGVSMAPFAESARSNLRLLLIEAAAGLALLSWTVWTVLGRSLGRVAEIARRASGITAAAPRDRLPLQGSGDEIDELSSVLNTMLAGLEGSLQQMEAFTSDAAHQLRTPMTRLRCDLDLILRTDEDLRYETRECLEEMRTELERLGQTCGRLLLLARLDCTSSEEKLLAEDVNLSEVVEELVDQMGPIAAEKGVSLCQTTPGTASARCIKALVVEALINLLDNALRISSAGKSIHIVVGIAGQCVTITVSDEGPGVPVELREKIFRRFFRGSNSTEGSGLGLSIVRGIARAHGGEVYVRTADTGGAAFVLTLPQRGNFSPHAQPNLRSAG